MFIKKKVKAFSLLEIAISLAIIGFLTMGVVKGRQILFKSKIEKTMNQVSEIIIATDSFRSSYYQMPGDYCGNDLPCLKKGDGNGLIESNIEQEAFWEHLSLSGMISAKKLIPAIGGDFSVFSQDGRNFLKISAGGKGILSPVDAQALKVKLGSAKVANGSGSSECVDSSGRLKSVDKKVCILIIELQ